MNRLFFFGFGFTASALHRRLEPTGEFQFAATARTPEKSDVLAAMGVQTSLVREDEPAPDDALAGATHILVSAPPGEHGDPVVRSYAKAIGAQAAGLRWLGYLSTTGVYGDRGGDWVDEDSPLRPNTARGQRRVDAEAAWRDLSDRYGLPLHIFRLAGIYGPGRNALVSLRAGRARRIVKPGQVFSRIHVDDAAQVLERSIAEPRPGRIYNVCDDEPSPPPDPIAFAAELLGEAAPPKTPFQDAELSPMARSFYADNKRVRNTRIKTELGVKLAYPTYREGLQALANTLGA